MGNIGTGPATTSRLPRRVFFALIAITLLAVAAVVAYSAASGWIPARSFAGAYTGIFLPLYFAAFLAILTVSFVISGNTLMYHFRTGTVQRATDPAWFWWIVGVQSLIALVLLIVASVNLNKFYG